MSDTPYKPDEAMARIEELVVTALGTRHPAVDDLAQIKFALRDLTAANEKVAALEKELREEKKLNTQVLKERDYYGQQWRKHEVEANRLRSVIAAQHTG